MKAKNLQKQLNDIAAIAKLQPIIFVAMIFNLSYGIINAVIGTIDLSFYIGITGACSIIFGIIKLYSLKKYNSPLTNDAENACVKNIAFSAMIMCFLHFSVAVVCLFFYENPANYDYFMVIFIAGAAFIKIALATINTIKTRKNHSKIIHYVRLTDAANALISLGLTQRAILYYVGFEYANTVSGAGGIIFSLCALAVCLVMIKKSVKELRSEKTAKVQNSKKENLL